MTGAAARGKSPAARARLRFALIAFVSLLVFFVAGVFLANPLVALVRPVVDVLAQTLGLAASVDADGQQGWAVPAGARFRPVLAVGQVNSVATLEGETLRLMMRGFPLFLALMVASGLNRKTPMQVVQGLLALLAIYVFSALAVINHLMAQSVQEMGKLLKDVPPSAILSVPQMPPASFFLARLFNALAIFVLPQIGPVAIWALLRPDAVRMLLDIGRPKEAAAAAG